MNLFIIKLSLIIHPFLFVRRAVPKVRGSIPGMGTHIFLFFFLSSFFFFNGQLSISTQKRGGFNGDAADSTEFCVVNCIANRSAKSFSRRESEKINKPQKFLQVLASCYNCQRTLYRIGIPTE